MPMRPIGNSSPFSDEQRAEFKRAIARFEEEWFAGRRPTIESFLPEERELRLVLLAELVQIDTEFRTKAGEPCRFDDYLARFPELSSDSGLVDDLKLEVARFRRTIE